MRRAITLVVLVTSLASTSIADAAGIHEFRVDDAGFPIGWVIGMQMDRTLCCFSGGPGRRS